MENMISKQKRHTTHMISKQKRHTKYTMYTDSITTYGVEFKFYHNTGETTNES
jgi:hypothetical protein